MNIKKKLLFVNGHLNVGGVERSLVDLLRHCDYSKYDIDLLLFEDVGDYKDEIPKEVNIIFYDLTKTYGGIYSCFKKAISNKDFKTIYIRIVFTLERILGINIKKTLRPIFKNLKEYDCAIAYRVGFCSEFVAYVIKAKKKITWWHHGSFEYDKKETQQIEKIYKNFDYIVSVSEGCKKMLIQNLSNIENKIKVIPNIIDTNYIEARSIEEVSGINEYRDFIKLVSIGRLSKEKCMINCVYCCKKLVDAGYNIKWILIGDGVEYENIEKEVEEYGLQENIHMLGSIKNPYKYLRHADIYVHPSNVESMSITVLEAMTLNIPVVVVASIGPSEFIVNDENGILVQPKIDDLYKGIVKMLANKDLRDKFSKSNRLLLLNYSQENILNKFYKLMSGDNNI